MTVEHEAHLARIKARLSADIDAKYRAGQQEHGGNLWELPGMLEQAYAEVLDLATYLLTLMEQRDAGRMPTGRDSGNVGPSVTPVGGRLGCWSAPRT